MPYIEAGLNNNELCICVTSGPLSIDRLREVMRDRIAGFDEYLKKGQVEVIPHLDWHVKNGIMDLDNVLAGWAEKLRQALDMGYSGLRASSDVHWLQKGAWNDFLEYEHKINRTISGRRMIALCTYPLDKCGADEILDVTSTHQFALIKRDGKWKVIENVEVREAKKTQFESESFLSNVFDCIQDGISVLDKDLNILRVNLIMKKWYGGDIVGKKCYKVYHGRHEPCEPCPSIRAIREKTMQKEIVHDLRGWSELYVFPMVDDKGEVTCVIEHVRDIDERKRAEDMIRNKQKELQAFVDGIPGYAFIKDKNGRTLMVNRKFCDDLGFSYDEPIGKTNYDLFPKDLAEKYTRDDERVFETGEPLLIEEEALVHGKRITVATRKIPLKDDKGKVMGLVGLGFDITELKRAERALKESEEKYRFLVENSKDVIWKIDLQGRWTFVSGNVEKMIGYRADEIVGKTVWDFVAPECHDILNEKLQKRMHGEEILPYELRIINRNGHYTPFEVLSAPILDKDGKIVGAQGISRDITLRKRAEKAMRESEEKFRQMAENIKEVFFIFTPDWKRTIYVSPAYEHVWGRSLNDIYNDPLDWLEGVHPGDRELPLALVENHIKGNISDTDTVEFRVQRPDGSTRWIHVRTYPVRNDRGEIYRITGIAEDITERKHTEDALRKLSQAVEDSPTAIVITDLNGDIEYVNPRFTQLTGYSLVEVIGKNPRILKSGETTAEEYKRLWDTILSGKEWRGEFHNKKKDGELYWESAVIAPIKDNEGGITHFIAIKEDITERKRTELELKSAKAQAELYLDLISHDINNMNQVSLGFLELALDMLNLDENGRSIISRSMGALENSSRLIDKVRKLQKARSGELSIQEIDLGQTLSDVCAYYLRMYDGNVAIYYEPVAGCKVMANELLYDVFSNIVDNAIKHTKDRPVVNIRLEEVDECNETFYKVTIEDNGMGVPEDLKSQIFDRFRRGDTKAKGKGLGLYLAKTLVESYNGRIWVEDRVPGDYTKGSKFVVLMLALPPTPDKRESDFVIS